MYVLASLCVRIGFDSNFWVLTLHQEGKCGTENLPPDARLLVVHVVVYGFLGPVPKITVTGK